MLRNIDRLPFAAPVIAVCLVMLGLALAKLNEPVPFCKIVGDHEIVTGHCIPYCPPKPSVCG